MNEKTTCPLCNGEMRYKKHNNTHIWVCEECPNVMFEYYDNENIADLSEFLTNDKKKELK